MKYLRILIVLYALAYIAGGILLLQQSHDGWNVFIFLYFILNALVIIFGTFFERSKYKSNSAQKEGWVKTKERFVDHNSGKMVEVYFHPESGERKYVEVE